MNEDRKTNDVSEPEKKEERPSLDSRPELELQNDFGGDAVRSPVDP